MIGQKPTVLLDLRSYAPGRRPHVGYIAYVPLLTLCSLAAVYVVSSALVIFNVEPETFDDFFDAIYWAVVSLTTMGYGDIYPVSTAGRIVTMIFAFFTYEFLDGTRVVLKSGEDGVTEADIALLHRMDDREVENNNKNVKPWLQEWQNGLCYELHEDYYLHCLALPDDKEVLVMKCPNCDKEMKKGQATFISIAIRW